MLKISFAGFLGLSSVILTQFTLEMCVAASNREKITKNPYFRVQGRSRLSMLVPLESSSAVLIMMHSKSLSICNRSRARLVLRGRNPAFWRGYQNLMPSYGGPLHPRGSNLTPLKGLMPNISYAGCSGLLAIIWWKPGVSISPGLDSVPGRDTGTIRQTDGRTDRIPIANTRSQQYMAVQLSRVKMLFTGLTNDNTETDQDCFWK